MNPAVRLFRSDRSCLLLILGAALVLGTGGLARRDLWDPDEPRTAVVTAAIVRSGSWAVLEQNGRPYLEKPPLYYWLAAAAAWRTGRVDAFEVRLPANAAALVTLVTVFYLGRNLFGRRAGTLAALVLLTTFDFFMEARWARPDMLLTCFLTVAALALWSMTRGGSSPAWLVVFYLMLGLAGLTKGPVGLLPLAAALVFLAASRNLGFLRRAGLFWGLPLMVAPVALWIAAWSARAGQPFPIGATLWRFAGRVTLGLHHAHPPAHLLIALPAALLPWVVFLPAAIRETWPRPAPGRDDRVVFLYSFLIAYLVLFALSAERRGSYLLPILPFIALLLGRFWDGALLGWDPSPYRIPVLGGLAAGVLLVVAGAAHYVPLVVRTDPGLARPAGLLAGAVTAAFLAPLLLHGRLGPGRALALHAAGLAGCYLIISQAVLPALDPHKSARPFATRIAVAAGSDPLAIYPDEHAAFVWYTGRRLVVLSTEEELLSFLRSASRTLCIVEESAWVEGPERLRSMARVVDRGQVGHRRMLLVQGGAG